jgi:hypothetical protein
MPWKLAFFFKMVIFHKFSIFFSKLTVENFIEADYLIEKKGNE